MKIGNISVYIINWSFQLPVQHNLATNEATNNLIIQIDGDMGYTGFGEGVPRPYVTGETMEMAVGFLRNAAIPAVLDREVDAEDIHSFPAGFFSEEQIDRFPSAICALETALWDLIGQASGKNVSEFLGGPQRADMVYSGVIPFYSPDKLTDLLDLAQLLELSDIKVKVGREDDEEIVRRIRRRFGNDLQIRLDANSAWSAEDAVRHIDRLSKYNITAVEQPVAKEDFPGLAFVKSRVEPLILADESICTLSDAKNLIDMDAVDGFNLRLSKCGGFSRTARLYELAREKGLILMLGSQVGELGILSAAGRQFASVRADLKYLEGSLTRMLMGRDVIEEDVTFGRQGRAIPFFGPGLGVKIRQDTLADSLVFKSG